MELKPRRSILGSAIAAAMLVPVAALVQQPQSQAQDRTLDDEITITGTRIARSGMVTPTPVTALQASDNFFDQEPRATAPILGRAGVNEFNQASLLYDILGRNLAVGARLTF